MNSKSVKDSDVTLCQLMLPEHANHIGTVHGGIIMKLVDETAGLCAMRHSRRPVVTLAIDSMTFHSPVQVGDMLVLDARLTWTGRTSMEVGVKVVAENLRTGERTHTNTAFLVYVALDDERKAIEVPPILLETEQQKRQYDEARARQRRRLERQRKAAKSEPGL